VTDPLVLLAFADEPMAAAVDDVLRRCSTALRLARVDNAPSLLERLAREPAAAFIASSRIDTSGAVDTVRRAARLSAQTRGIVLFDDPGDRRRALVATAGAYDYVLAPGGDLATLLGVLDRILTRSALEARLEAAQRHVRALVDNSNDGIYTLKGGRFVYVNLRFEEMVGFSAEQLMADDFSLEEIVAERSRSILKERQRRIQQGAPVESRYEFEAKRGDGGTFDAQVSVSYIEVDGEPATLGIMQDITERKRFELELVRKNQELALLNELASAVSSTVDLDETLRAGCRRVNELCGFSASGISLLSKDGGTLELRLAEGLVLAVVESLSNVPTGNHSLLAHAVKTGEVQVVRDIRSDDRILLDEVREARYEGCVVVPLEARQRILGAAFFFTAEGKKPREDQTELLFAIGSMLGAAIEKATVLELERAAVRRLRALDDIALAVANSLDLGQVAETVARNLRRVFDAQRVVIARYVKEEDIFVPLCAVDGDERLDHRALARDESLMGLALASEVPIQRLHPDSPFRPVSWDTTRLVPRYDARLFVEGFGTTVALRVVSDGAIVGAMHLAYTTPRPIDQADLDALAGLGHHVAVAVKNAELFAARKQALEDLKAAQDKLVQSEKLNALGELAAGVAHDFNNVLGAILGRAQLLQNRLTEPDLKKHASIIEKAATDGAETVRRIQEIGRQDTTDDFTPVDVHEILQDVADLTMSRWRERTRSEGRPVDLVVEPWSHGRPFVRGNPHELREVLINLVHNAVDAMPQGGPLTLGARVAGGEGGETCEIRVADTGTGMPASVRVRIFDPFFTTKGDRGTGLGLSVSYSIVQRHGGDIEVTSVTEGPEHGTTFTLRLPRIEAPAEVPPAVRAMNTSELGPDRARVLVIDDEENIRDILSDILETGDHVVVTAADGPAGLELLAEASFDLVFTDLGLPGMSGYEVAAQVKQRFPDLPVGLVTGWGATLDAEKALLHGVDLVLNKPFRFDQVLKLVDDALAARVRRE
jgi:PAS domain S-box-containing protein